MKGLIDATEDLIEYLIRDIPEDEGLAPEITAVIQALENEKGLAYKVKELQGMWRKMSDDFQKAKAKR